ncbi:MAG: hypothetical protein M3065_01685 [Actinomycetota bacterium]|nr:hypothetical protein [Actinomycetota bacterium]
MIIVSGPCGAGKTTVGRLVAAAFELSAHIQADHFMPFVVNGWDGPWPESEQQNDVIGAAIGAAALEFAVGGYTVVLDGHMFPEGVEGLAQWSERRGVALHYAVLRPDLATCLARAEQRRPGDPQDLESFTRVHARFDDLADREVNVLEATGTPDEVAADVLAAFSSGGLRVRGPGVRVDGRG